MAAAPESREASLRRSRNEFESARRELESSAGDCTAACRALASMERAAGRLCSLASEPSEQRQCEDAKDRLERARARVRGSCGPCS
jgi:hypothetical protein